MNATKMNKRECYKNGNFEGERALFFLSSCDIENCLFHDGESPLKEGRDLNVNKCTFQWKYPLWYGENHIVKECVFLETARSGIWYTHNSEFVDCEFKAVKYFRRCHDIKIIRGEFLDAQETLWSCRNVFIKDSTFKGDYLLKDSVGITLENIRLDGNYLLDGGKDIHIKGCLLNSKDAFWNSQNVLIEDSTIIGEYFGWNAKNVTLRRCKIVSNQGFCYMDNVTIEDCYLEGTTLSFEYSSGKAKVLDVIDSVKNPSNLKLICKGIKELIINDDKRDEQIGEFKYTYDLNKGFDDEF